jgi:hypothetical protein
MSQEIVQLQNAESVHAATLISQATQLVSIASITSALASSLLSSANDLQAVNASSQSMVAALTSRISAAESSDSAHGLLMSSLVLSNASLYAELISRCSGQELSLLQSRVLQLEEISGSSLLVEKMLELNESEAALRSLSLTLSSALVSLNRSVASAQLMTSTRITEVEHILAADGALIGTLLQNNSLLAARLNAHELSLKSQGSSLADAMRNYSALSSCMASLDVRLSANVSSLDSRDASLENWRASLNLTSLLSLSAAPSKSGFTTCTMVSASFSGGSTTTAQCATGFVLTGGGYYCGASTPSVGYSYTNGNGWTAGGCFYSYSGTYASGKAYAVCCQ